MLEEAFGGDCITPDPVAKLGCGVTAEIREPPAHLGSYEQIVTISFGHQFTILAGYSAGLPPRSWIYMWAYQGSGD